MRMTARHRFGRYAELFPAALHSAADSLWSEEEIEAAISICGDSVNGLLDGSDPCAHAGRLDESAELLDRDPSLREQFIKRHTLCHRGCSRNPRASSAAIGLCTGTASPKT